MKHISLLLVALVLSGSSHALFISPSFPASYWSADGVVVGKLLSEAETTIEIEVEAWLRDSTTQHESRIRAFRFRKVFSPPESYRLNSRYVFLMSRVNNRNHPEAQWKVLQQLPLNGVSVCLDTIYPKQPQVRTTDCVDTVAESVFLDALEVLSDCYRLIHRRSNRGHETQYHQTCSPLELKRLAAQSPMHMKLAQSGESVAHYSAERVVLDELRKEPTLLGISNCPERQVFLSEAFGEGFSPSGIRRIRTLLKEHGCRRMGKLDASSWPGHDDQVLKEAWDGCPSDRLALDVSLTRGGSRYMILTIRRSNGCAGVEHNIGFSASGYWWQRNPPSSR